MGGNLDLRQCVENTKLAVLVSYQHGSYVISWEIPWRNRRRRRELSKLAAGCITKQKPGQPGDCRCKSYMYLWYLTQIRAVLEKESVFGQTFLIRKFTFPCRCLPERKCSAGIKAHENWTDLAGLPWNSPEGRSSSTLAGRKIYGYQ